MGFPMGCCSELAVPRLLVYLVVTLAAVRRALLLLLDVLGLAGLLDGPAPDGPLPVPRGGWDPPPARLLEALPAVPYAAGCGGEEGCAVCLHELEEGQEVRRLRECRHVFHSGCLDPWVALGRRTCPLCRTPLLAGEGEEQFEDREDEYGYLEELLPAAGDELMSFVSPEELLLAAAVRGR